MLSIDLFAVSDAVSTELQLQSTEVGASSACCTPSTHTNTETIQLDLIPMSPTEHWHPTVSLSFDPVCIRASPHSLQIAQCWPSNPSVQQLLRAVIELHAQMKTGTTLTAPTAVALAGCALRMAGHLIGCAFKSIPCIDSAAPLANLSILFIETRENALQRFQVGGWEAASPIPHACINSWWYLSKDELQRSGSPSTAAAPLQVVQLLEDEELAEQAVMGAIVAEWIQLLIGGMCYAARELGSPLLSLGILESALNPSADLLNHRPLEYHHRKNLHQLYKKLDCHITPQLDSMQILLEHVTGHGPVEDTWDIAHLQQVVNNLTASTEEIAALRILDCDGWYHQPKLMKTIAKQFISGQRRLHFSDQLLSDLKVQPMRVEYGLLPSNLCSFCNMSHNSPSSRTSLSRQQHPRLHLKLTDANGVEWPLELEFDDKRGGQLSSPGMSALADRTLATLHPTKEAGRGVRVSVKSAQISKSIIWRDFQPNLSQKQKQALNLLKQAEELSRSNEADQQIENQSQRLLDGPSGRSQDAESPNKKEMNVFEPVAVMHPYFWFNSDSSQYFEGFHLHRAMVEWSSQEFQRIALQCQPLLDHQKLGSARYKEMHTEKVRRNFQGCLIDAAMEVNELPLMPMVLLELIADYHTMETMPYITPEEQQSLLEQQSDE